MFSEISLNWYGIRDSLQICYKYTFDLICVLIIAKWGPQSTHKYNEPKGLIIHEPLLLWNAHFESVLIMAGGSQQNEPSVLLWDHYVLVEVEVVGHYIAVS